MSAADAVLENATYHAQLLAQITELDYVPPALQQQDIYIDGLEKDAGRLVREISALAKKTKKERKEHESIRDSTARRFTAKITGRKDKFEAKASKEEREYVEALEQETQVRRQHETVETLIAEAKAVRMDLHEKQRLYRQTKTDLAALYSQIFDGPTQAYPEDDQLEYQFTQAQTRYDEIQGALNRESQAVNMLQRASTALQACSGQVKEALSYSQWDVYGGGGMSDMMERNALSSAEGHASQAQIYVEQAMAASPQVQPIGQISIAHGSIISDVIFDNIFTDLAFHDKIKTSARNVEAVQFNLMKEFNLARSRAGAIGADLNAAADALARTRGALDAFRRSVFEGLQSGEEGSGLPSPPSYASSQPDVQVTMPRGPGDVGSSYTPPSYSGYSPPPGPPPAGGSSGTSSPPPSMPAMPMPSMPSLSSLSISSSSTTYAPPPGPPPTQTQTQTQRPETQSTSYAPPLGPPPGPAGARAASPSAWGSRNPYAAALAKGESPAGGSGAGEEEGAGVSGPPVPPKS